MVRVSNNNTGAAPDPDRPAVLRQSYGPLVLLVILGALIYLGSKTIAPAVVPPDATAAKELRTLREENQRLKAKVEELTYEVRLYRDRAAIAEMKLNAARDQSDP